MKRPLTAEGCLKLLLRFVGSICLLGLVSLWMPRAWIEASHRWLGWGEFPMVPTAEYLARSVSALSAFYGGLLIVLSFDVRRYALLVCYQAVAIMALSGCGLVVGRLAGLPLWFVGGDMAVCWSYCLSMLVLVWRVKHGHA